jgi:hypothetical protein
VTSSSEIFTIVISGQAAVNYPPTFSSNPPDDIVPLKTFKVYEFPTITDSSNDIVTTEVFSLNQTSLDPIPAFINNFIANKSLTIYPTLMS